jgi:hypothetical protein
MTSKPDIVAGIAGVVAQAGIGYFLLVTYAAFGLHWFMFLGEPSPPLPLLTIIALSLIRLVPIAAVLLILVGAIVPTLRNHLLWWTFAVVLMEAVVLAAFMMGLALPALSITYRLT